MKRQAEDLKTRMCRTVEQNSLFLPGQTVVVAVSGGPDSTALLHALSEMRAEWKLSLVAAHLNHGFRGAEAEGDAEYVAALCLRLDVPCVIEKADVPAMRRRRHLSAQEAAREVRHAFLRRVAYESGAMTIALGHTRDDQIETVLMHILRGTGLEGLTGLCACAPPLVRPLLDVSREETLSYCVQHVLSPRHDSSNKKLDYQRNRVRAELLPHLTSYYNQRIGDSIFRLSSLAAADNELLENLAEQALATVVLSKSANELCLNTSALRELPLALRRRTLRRAIAVVRGDLQNIGMETTERALDAVQSGQNLTINLPIHAGNEIRIAVTAQEIRVYREQAQTTALAWEHTLSVPGFAEIPEAGIRTEARRLTTWQEAREQASADSLLYREAEIYLPLTLRSWQPGDRMRPRGLGGTKKLQDLFTDRKIEAEARHRLPILVDATGRVLAVLGVRADELALDASEPEFLTGKYAPRPPIPGEKAFSCDRARPAHGRLTGNEDRFILIYWFHARRFHRMETAQGMGVL